MRILLISILALTAITVVISSYITCLFHCCKCYTPFTRQAVTPAVTHVWGNVPVLGSPSDIRMQPCESVANCPLPCFKIFDVSASDFGTVSMHR